MVEAQPERRSSPSSVFQHGVLTSEALGIVRFVVSVLSQYRICQYRRNPAASQQQTWLAVYRSFCFSVYFCHKSDFLFFPPTSPLDLQHNKSAHGGRFSIHSRKVSAQTLSCICACSPERWGSKGGCGGLPYIPAFLPPALCSLQCV